MVWKHAYSNSDTEPLFVLNCFLADIHRHYRDMCSYAYVIYPFFSFLTTFY